MEPLRPQVKRAVLDANPQAQPEDIEDYERLLAERFARDPDVPSQPSDASLQDTREARLRQLHNKLFPAASRDPRQAR